MDRAPAAPAGVPPDLEGHPDRLKWNARYRHLFAARFTPHPLAAAALALPPPYGPLPDGPVLDLASGPSGSALAAAAAGREVIAVDASEVALTILAKEAARRGLAGLVTPVQADLRAWRPEPGSYALVLGTGYWDRDLFPGAAAAVAAGGLLAWEAFTAEARQSRPGLEPGWCLDPGEPASLLPAGYEVLAHPAAETAPGGRRRLLARRSR